MADLFHADGCVKANIRTQRFKALFAAKCGHCKVQQAEFILDAPSPEDAAQYARDHLCPPRMELVHVETLPRASQPDEREDVYEYLGDGQSEGHQHTYQGQTLRHVHVWGRVQHGYFGHPEDGGGS